MTADIELLPIPAEDYVDDEGLWEKRYGPYSHEQMQAYARANVAHAVAPLQAKVKALRAEVERLKSMTAVTMGIGSGDGNLFVHGDYDSIKAAQTLVFRAERMEKALRLIESAKDRGFGIDYARGVAQSILIHDQEEGHEQ